MILFLSRILRGVSLRGILFCGLVLKRSYVLAAKADDTRLATILGDAPSSLFLQTAQLADYLIFDWFSITSEEERASVMEGISLLDAKFRTSSDLLSSQSRSEG